MKPLAIDVDLYRVYGISEWHNKCQVLTIEEQLAVLSDLKKGCTTELVELVKLPFPQFIENYFLPFSAANDYFKDPSFAYKLYFLDDSYLRLFTEKMRAPSITYRQIIETYSIKPRLCWEEKIGFLEHSDLEELSHIQSSTAQNRDYYLKYIYLTQYIDIAEAMRLELPIVESFLKDGSNGYDLEGKLAMLNPAAKHILELYIGLHGHRRHSLSEIGELIVGKRKSHYIRQIVAIFMSKILKSSTEFAYYIGYKEELQTPGVMHQYISRDFRNLDILVETQAHFARLDEATQAYLMTLTEKERTVYLAAKFMYTTPETLANNLVISSLDAQRRLDTLR